MPVPPLSPSAGPDGDAADDWDEGPDDGDEIEGMGVARPSVLLGTGSWSASRTGRRPRVPAGMKSARRAQ